MKHSTSLTIASLLSILFFTFHLSGDIVRGIEKGGFGNLPAFPMAVVWLYGTLLLAERRSGYIITLLGSLLGLLLPLAHMRGKGLASYIARSNASGANFYVWTLIAIGVTALFSLVLSVRGLWSLRRGQPSESNSAMKGTQGAGA